MRSTKLVFPPKSKSHLDYIASRKGCKVDLLAYQVDKPCRYPDKRSGIVVGGLLTSYCVWNKSSLPPASVLQVYSVTLIASFSIFDKDLPTKLGCSKTTLSDWAILSMWPWGQLRNLLQQMTWHVGSWLFISKNQPLDHFLWQVYENKNNVITGQTSWHSSPNSDPLGGSIDRWLHR